MYNDADFNKPNNAYLTIFTISNHGSTPRQVENLSKSYFQWKAYQIYFYSSLGFWNFIVYVKPRYIDKGIVVASVTMNVRAQFSKVGSSRHLRNGRFKRNTFKNDIGNTDITSIVSQTNTKEDNQASTDQEGLESSQKADISLDMIREDEPEIIPFDPNSVEPENDLDYNMLLAG